MHKPSQPPPYVGGYRFRVWLFVIIALGGIITLFERCRTYREHSQDRHILAAAKKYGVDPALVKAVVWRESRFDPRVRGDAGEIGLMQVGKLAAEEWAEAENKKFFRHAELYDAGKNTDAGTWYLRKMLRRYAHTDRPAAYALADYNAGRSNVLRWNKGAASTNSAAFLKQMDYPGTRAYVEAILKRWEKYKHTFPKTT
ncbi:MAG: transglycosylase SLT domain-containing protein [Verrucomicrobia subdivision 3 bacterium]|nr:transglycosylase SLT domain-containing protein [Limisphaerales bacterium]